MKNPIKNGKEVFAVLSMATVMSISMSVKVNAASEIDAAAESAATAVVQSENTNTTSSFKEVKTNSDPSSEKREEVSAIDSKESSTGENIAVVESANSPEVSGDKKSEALPSQNPSTESENVEGANASDPSEATEEASAVDEKASTEKIASEANAEDEKASENLETSEEKVEAPLRDGQEATDPNYAEDEKKIKDYSDEERYRSTQMEQGAGTTDTSTTPSLDSKDGFSYETLEPSATSDDKTQWGLEMEFDKEKGQRTYTDFGFTNTGNYGRPSTLEPGNISANEVGDKLSDKGDFQDPNYKADAEIVIDGKGQIKNLNLYATEEDLKHINSKENDKTIMAWEGKYTKDNPNGHKATQGDSAAFTFTVNPWPNENDKLELIKLNGSHDQKEFVQGQTITTNVKVDNLDASARERLVGQVYHPLTGEVVPGAKAL